MRRTIEVLGWAAGLPPERHEEGRDVLRRTQLDAITSLRQSRPSALAALGVITPLHAVLAIALFLLGLGVGLTFGGEAH